MKKKISLFVLAMFLLVSKMFSGDLPETIFAISPGINFGYVFGTEDSFSYGFEISVSYLDSKKLLNFGGVLAIDFNKNYQKIHVGGEFIMPIIAFDIGPTFLIDKKNNISHLGYTISPFITGGMIFPIFSYSNFSMYKSIFELGVILKYPFIQEDENPGWRHALD